jgi:hypothetical protein
MIPIYRRNLFLSDSLFEYSIKDNNSYFGSNECIGVWGADMIYQKQLFIFSFAIVLFSFIVFPILGCFSVLTSILIKNFPKRSYVKNT